MNRDRVWSMVLLATMVFLLIMFFRGNSKLNEVKRISENLESSNQQLQVENEKLKGSLLKYHQLTDSLNLLLVDMDTLENEVLTQLSNSIRSLDLIKLELDLMIEENKKALQVSQQEQSDDNIDPIIP